MTARGFPFAGLRLGMAQLTNTVARAVLLVTLGEGGLDAVAARRSVIRVADVSETGARR